MEMTNKQLVSQLQGLLQTSDIAETERQAILSKVNELVRENDESTYTDWYLVKMMYAHWKAGTWNTPVSFNLFIRKLPFESGSDGKSGFGTFFGLEHIVKWIQNLEFTDEIIEYFKRKIPHAEPQFWNEMKKFKFTGDIYSVKEGEIIFPNIPLVRVEARVFEAIYVQTALLAIVNHESLIATKAARIMQATAGAVTTEGGARRCHGLDAGVYGARAAVGVGFSGTSNVKTGQLFDLELFGSMEHAWIQFFPTELEAFRAYADAFPDEASFLVDTYDTLGSGVPNAIIAAKEMEAKGKKAKNIRLDSGDLAYLSKEARRMLDEAGLDYMKIIASSDLDEYVISDLKAQGAKIDAYLVGTKVITAYDKPALGPVYKLVAVDRDGNWDPENQLIIAEREGKENWEPVIKLSQNIEKLLNPGRQNAYRLYGYRHGVKMAEGDLITLFEENIKDFEEVKIEDPSNPLIKVKKIRDFEAVELLHPIFQNGELVYSIPEMKEIQAFHAEQLGFFWEEYRRKSNPETYPVGLSDKLKETKQTLIEKHLGRH